MLTPKDVRRIARQEAAQLLADFAIHLRTICEQTPDGRREFIMAENIDRALGAVITPILKPDAGDSPGA